MPLHVIFRRPAGRLARTAVMAAAVAAGAGCPGDSPGPLPEAPSVLIIVVDTLRADHVGSLRRQGDPGTASTPAIDRWAEGATRFSRASTPAPFTMPAMASLLAGVYPDRTGVVAHEAGTTLATWTGDTLPEAARRAGMRTAAIVANPWLARASTGFDRGFDEFVRLYQSGGAAHGSDAAAVTDAAIRVLDAARGERFFAWAHYFDPHMPYSPPRELAGDAGTAPSRVMTDFDAKERDLEKLYRGDGYTADELERARRLYEGEVRYADREVGRLLDHLAAIGRSNDTIVVVASDHGESLGEHGLFFAHDFTLYDELVRAVLLLKAPGSPGSVREDDASLLDVAPTICALARLPCRGGFDGRDLLTPPAAQRVLFAATTPRRRRGTPWARLEVSGLEGRWTMARSGSKKVVRIPTRDGTVWERYDLAADPLELGSRGEPGSRGEIPGGDPLCAELERWIEEMNAARPPAPALPSRRQQRRDEKALRSLGYLE